MERTLRAAKRARARLTARGIVDRAGRWLVVGAAAGAAFVGMEKVWGLPGAWWAWMTAPIAAAGIAAVIVELMRARPLLESASVVDTELGLKDRMGSALALAGMERAGGADDAFVKVALEDSERIAETSDAARAVPIRFGNSWWTWPAIAAAGVAGAIWAPESAALQKKELRRMAQAAEASEQVRAADEIREATRAAAPPPPETADAAADTVADPLAARRLAALQKLEEELRTGKIDSDTAREEGARTLEQAAAELEKRAAEAQRTADAVRDTLAELPKSEEPVENALTRAVRQGDMRAAREAAQELMQQADQLSPEDRARVARDLQRLADELGTPRASPASPPVDQASSAPDDAAPNAQAGDQPPRGDEAGELDHQLREDLKEQGLSEDQAKEVGNSAGESAARKRLEELGLPPEAAQKLAERIEEDVERRRAEKQANEHTEELSRSLKEAAEQLSEEPKKAEPPAAKDEEKSLDDPARDAGSQQENGASKEPPASSSSPADAPAPTPRAGEELNRKQTDGANGAADKPASQEKPESNAPSKPAEGGAPASGERAAEKKEGSESGAGDKKEGATEKRQATEGGKQDSAPQSDEKKGSSGPQGNASKEGEQPSSERKEAAAREQDPGRDQKEPASPDGRLGSGPQPQPDGKGTEGQPPAGAKPESPTRPTPGEKTRSDDSSAPNPRGQGDERQPGKEQADDGRSGDDLSGQKQAEKQQVGDKTDDKTDRAPDPAAKDDGEEAKEPGNDRTPNLDNLPDPDSAQGRAMKRVIDNLRKLEKDQQDAARDRVASQEMRERAKKMLDGATPEQRRKLEKWANEFAKEQPPRNDGERGLPSPADPPSMAGSHRETSEGAGVGRDGSTPRSADDRHTERTAEESSVEDFKTDVVDARSHDNRDPPTGGRIAGELSNDGAPGAPMLSKQEALQAVQRASQSAQRAIDDRTIPGRYDKLLQRYFKRLPAKIEDERPK